MINHQISRLIRTITNQTTKILSCHSPITCKPKFQSSAMQSVEQSFEQRAKSFFEFEEIEKNVYRTNKLNTSDSVKVQAYGGLIFSQALAVAEKTVDINVLKPHSIHSYFITAVNTAFPIEYHVACKRDGRSFALREVEAYQKNNLCFTLQVSFHIVERDSVIHQDKMPNVPHWKDLTSTPEVVKKLHKQILDGELNVTPVVANNLKYVATERDYSTDLFEMKPCHPPDSYGFSENPSRTICTWFRSNGELTTDCESLHRLLVCYNSDIISGCVVYPHLRNNFTSSLICSLDHNVWIHNYKMRADEWLLYECTSPISNAGRGLAYGRLWTEDGRLILTAAQEALVRTRSQTSSL